MKPWELSRAILTTMMAKMNQVLSLLMIKVIHKCLFIPSYTFISSSSSAWTVISWAWSWSFLVSGALHGESCSQHVGRVWNLQQNMRHKQQNYHFQKTTFIINGLNLTKLTHNWILCLSLQFSLKTENTGARDSKENKLIQKSLQRMCYMLHLWIFFIFFHFYLLLEGMTRLDTLWRQFVLTNKQYSLLLSKFLNC